MSSLNQTLKVMNDMFFEWYVKPTAWYASHEPCPTCEHGKPSKACYIALLKTFGEPEATS